MKNAVNSPIKSLTTKTLEGLSWTYISLIFQAVLQLVTLAVLARMLGPEEFGVVSLALIFTTFIERVGFLGIGPALVQKKSLSESEIKGAFSFSVLLGLVILIIFYVSAPYAAISMNDPLLRPVLQWLSVLCLIESASQINSHLLQRELKFKEMLISGNIAYAIGNGFVSISLALLDFGVWSLVYGSIVNRLLRFLFFYYLRPIKFTLFFSFRGIKDLLLSGIGFAWSRLFSFIAISGDNFIVGKVLGTAALGIYGRAYQLMTLPSNYFGQVLEKVLFPAMAKKQADKENLKKVYLWAIQLSAIVGIPSSIFMYISSKEIVLVLFGIKWLEVIPTLEILSLGVFFRLAYKNSDTLIRSVGAVYRHAIRQLAYCVVVIAGSLYGVKFGTVGVAYAVLIAVLVNYLVLSEMGLKILNLSIKDFVMAHAAGAWIGLWSLLLTPQFFNFLRNLKLQAFYILLAGVVFQTVIFLISNKLCPKIFKASVLTWIIERFGLKRKGKAGQLIAKAIV